jgi:hypothetical protein
VLPSSSPSLAAQPRCPLWVTRRCGGSNSLSAPSPPKAAAKVAGRRVRLGRITDIEIGANKHLLPQRSQTQLEHLISQRRMLLESKQAMPA